MLKYIYFPKVIKMFTFPDYALFFGWPLPREVNSIRRPTKSFQHISQENKFSFIHAIFFLSLLANQILCGFCTRYLALRLCVDNSDKADCLEFCQSEKSIWPHTQNLFLLCHFLSTWEIQRKALFLCWQLQH